jgi:hypothetical protein
MSTVNPNHPIRLVEEPPRVKTPRRQRALLADGTRQDTGSGERVGVTSTLMLGREGEPGECPTKDLNVWNAYSSRVPQSSLPIVRALFERICGAVHARGLGWNAYRDGQTIGFKSTPNGTFKIAVHVGAGARPQDRVSNPPSFLIHPDPPVQLAAEANPYPDLPTFWNVTFGAQGWNVFTESRIPDVGLAVDLAAKHGRE